MVGKPGVARCDEKSLDDKAERLCSGTWSKKPLTSVSKRVPGVHGKRGLERGWQKRLAKGWRKVGERLAKGWQRVGEGLAKGFLAPSHFGVPEAPV